MTDGGNVETGQLKIGRKANFDFEVLPNTPIPDKHRGMFREAVSPGKKHELLDTDLESMRSLFLENGIPFPANMFDRLFLVSHSDYMDVNYRQGPGNNVMGFVSPDRLAIIDFESFTTEDQVREVGIHELAHTLAYKERWVIPDDWLRTTRLPIRGSAVKRDGLFESTPTDPFSPESAGSRSLQEGFMDYVAREVTGRLSLHASGAGYQQSLELIDLMVAKVGAKPFFAAMYTQKGLDELKTVLDGVYDPDAWKRITTQVGKDAQEASKSRPFARSKTLLGDKIPRLVPWGRKNERV